MATAADDGAGVSGRAAEGAEAVRVGVDGTRFADLTGAAWALRITVGDLAALRRCGLDLSRPGEAVIEIGRKAVEEPEKLVEMAYMLAGGQHSEVTPEGFAKAIDGPSLRALATALSFAVADFFPIPSVGERLRGLLTENLTVENSTSNGSAGKPVEPLDSTPAATPSAN